ncbi:MAG TPA: hypothetical protein VFA66_02985 [Gaiellaceae bacterium]|nr:hypothetical protein [Gaiellaceae bacterium]
MSERYLILIEELVRDGRPEREIEQIVEGVVAEDERAEGLGVDDGEPGLRAA